MAYSASLIAYAFVRKGIESGNYVTQMKLQKMVYFAHGYHLAKFGEPLVEEKFQAWKYGPVIPDLYRDYKMFGDAPIFEPDLIVKSPSINDLNGLCDSAKESIDYTWEVTKNLTASQLSKWSHAENSPWDNAYIPGVESIQIQNNDIQDYFDRILVDQNG